MRLAKTAGSNMAKAYIAGWILDILAAHGVSVLLLTAVAIIL